MKIILVGGVEVPSSGGIENYVFNLAKQLKIKGHECSILCRGNNSEEYELDDIRISKIKVHENQFAILSHNIKASLKILKDFKDYDVVNYQSIYLPFFYEWIPKILGIKVLHTQHSFAQDNPKHGKISRLIIDLLYKASSLIFSPIITVSEQNRYLIKKRMWKDAKVINCGVELPLQVEPTDLMRRLNIIKGQYYLSIGRIDPVKNLDILIRAFLLHEQDSNIQLVIAGNSENSYGAYLKEIAGKDKRIIFIGPVYGIDKAALLTNCMAYCLVSKSEGFPIALLEAMSYGKPCLCSEIPANKEALTTSLGLWSNVNDEFSLFKTMKLVESDPRKYKEIGMKLKQRIFDNLTWDKVALEYVDYLHSIGIK